MEKKQGGVSVKTKIAIAVAFLMLFGVIFGACTPHTDYFEPFRGSFTAEVEGTLNGEAFVAELCADAAPEDGGSREVTVTFYAPEGLKGTEARRSADGSVTLTSGGVVIKDARAEGLHALFDLFPLSGEVIEVELCEEEHTRVTGKGFTLTFLSDGSPLAVETPTVTANVVRFEKG
jgi:hypothetical protein